MNVYLLLAGLGVLVFGGVVAAPQITSMNSRFDGLFQKYGKQFGVPWLWLKAICMNESSLGAAKSVAEGLRDPANQSPLGVDDSKSYDGKSWGIMQVTLTTAKDFDSGATVAKLNNAEYSVKIAAEYVAWCMRRFSSADPRFMEWVIKSYNQGVGNTSNEAAGKNAGYANEYWERFKRNLTKLGG